MYMDEGMDTGDIILQRKHPYTRMKILETFTIGFQIWALRLLEKVLNFLQLKNL